LNQLSDRPILRQLAAPRVSPLRLTSQVKRRPELLEALLSAVSSKTARVKLGAAKALRILSERTPEPYLVDTIARHILEVERATYATPECRNVALGHAINSLDRLFPIIAGKRAIQLFVSRQMGNTRAATRKKAERFLRKWPATNG
jgi:hypothetical protein